MGALIGLIVALFVGVALFTLAVNPVIGKISDDAIRIDQKPNKSESHTA